MLGVFSDIFKSTFTNWIPKQKLIKEGNYSKFCVILKKEIWSGFKEFDISTFYEISFLVGILDYPSNLPNKNLDHSFDNHLFKGVYMYFILKTDHFKGNVNKFWCKFIFLITFKVRDVTALKSIKKSFCNVWCTNSEYN